jgi:hypothetical protein
MGDNQKLAPAGYSVAGTTVGRRRKASGHATTIRLRGSPLCDLQRPDLEAPLMNEKRRANTSRDREADLSEADADATDRAVASADLADKARKNPTVHQHTDALAHGRLHRLQIAAAAERRVPS